MPRKLKTYQTSLGFFDLAVAAPSMKAALEAWGSEANLFHQGFAKEVDDPTIIAATMAKPGLVLRRPVGSDAPFSDHAAFPKNLSAAEVNEKPAERTPKSPPAPQPGHLDDNATRKAALAFAREQARRERERRRQQAVREAEHKRRCQAVANAKAALEEAKRTHDITLQKIAAARAALDQQSEAEEDQWDKQRTKLQAALDRARE